MKNLTNHKKQEGLGLSQSKGFTIIEVLIVLAIAGLIILIVFLAVPALQRNSRNTQTREDASKVLAVMQEAINNNNGRAPIGTVAPTAITNLFTTTSQLTGVNYNVHATAFQALPGALNRETAYLRNFSVCGPGGNGQISLTGGTSRQITSTYLVESPGTGAANGVPAGFSAQCTAM